VLPAPETETASLPARVYTPDSALSRPGQLFQEMFRDLWASRELAWRLFARDLSARYRQSLLGYLWAFAPPIASTVTFVLLNHSGVMAGGDPRIPYPAFVMIGMLLWQVFSDATSSPNKAVVGARAMLGKINFPREAVLLAGVFEVLFNFFIRVLLVIPLFLYYGIHVPSTILLAFPGVIAILLLGLMIGVLLTPAGILYTDVSQALNLSLTFWMLFTPVVYSPPSHGLLATISRLNPVSPLVVSTREVIFFGSASQPWISVFIFGITLILLFAGWVLYRLAMPILVERMGG
jgi:lipopolysaccharide transport system permease protein